MPLWIARNTYTMFSARFGGAGSTTSSDTYVTIANSDIALDPAIFKLSDTLYVRFIYHLRNQTADKIAYIQVYRQDAASAVANSEETVTGTTWTVKDTGWLDWSSESGAESYQIQLKTESGGTAEYNSALMIISATDY